MSTSLQRFENYREELIEVLRLYDSFEEYYGISPSSEDLRIIASISQEELDGEETIDCYAGRENYIQTALGLANPELPLDSRILATISLNDVRDYAQEEIEIEEEEKEGLSEIPSPPLMDLFVVSHVYLGLSVKRKESWPIYRLEFFISLGNERSNFTASPISQRQCSYSIFQDISLVIICR